MKAYSQVVRERVVRAGEHGYPRAEVVKLLGISLATIKRYLKQQREWGMSTLTLSLAVPPGSWQPCKRVCLSSRKRMLMSLLSDIVNCGSKRMTFRSVGGP